MKRVQITPGEDWNTEGVWVSIGEASYPEPFRNELEFNPPVHETWNIVHIGMLVPEAHQIYICSDNCMRGVVLTAAEMGLLHRFSCVVVEEGDLYDGNLETITIEGITDVLHKLPELPPAVLVFPVCLHLFMGCDLAYVYSELEKRFPQVDFMRCLMDPIMQKGGLTPDQKLRKAMLEKVPELSVKENVVSIVGDNLALEEGCEIFTLLRGSEEAAAMELRQIQSMEKYPEFQKLGESRAFLTRSPNGAYAAELLAKRLGRPWLYIPPTYGYEEIRAQIKAVAELLDRSADMIDMEAYESACDEALASAHMLIGNTPIMLDYIACVRPLGAARLLLEHGFNVRAVYLDAISTEEEKDFVFLQKEHPSLTLCCTNHVKARVLHGGKKSPAPEGQKVLAIGPKAAWFVDTPYFVNIIENGGLWGYSGIQRLAGMMIEAFLVPKNTRDIVPRKGLGCPSAVMHCTLD